MKRRTLVRLLVGFGIGIPVVVELLTFTGLIESELFGDGSESDDGDAGVPPGEVVAVGDEVLERTPQTERIVDLAQLIDDGRRRFRIAVAVEDPTDDEYTLTMDRVAFDDGTVLEQERRDRLAAGEAGEITASWRAPEDAEPVALVIAAETEGERYAERVRFGKIPVSRAPEP